MEQFNALKLADEVRTFPNIDMPAPAPKATLGTGKKHRITERHKSLFYNNSTGPSTVALPGLLRTRKTKLSEAPAGRSAPAETFTGFNATAFKLDLGDSLSTAYESIAQFKTEAGQNFSSAPQQLTNNLAPVSEGNNSATMSTRSNASTTKVKNDSTLEELRNYITLMDKYSLHNFMIYEGYALVETPEFQSFKRTYQFKWGSIAHIIKQLEEFFQQHDVKLAIINGPRLFDLSKLNLPSLERKDLFSMITNIDQIELQLDEADGSSSDGAVQRIIMRVQTLMRGWIARVRFRKLQKSISASILLQAIIRKFLYRRQTVQMLRQSVAENQARFFRNRTKLEYWWQSRSKGSEDRTRLVIYIPSISVQEYLRMDFENFRAMQNSHISNLFQLADPDLNLVYITPFLMTNHDKAYHEKFLALLGVSILPKRLHFITPEQINHLPQHLSLASALWYSPGALNKLRTFTRRFQSSIVVPASVTWVEKRIASYLDISLLAPESSIAETISSRSFMKSIFMEASINIPLGSHDIYSLDDLFVALSRLISSNVGVSKWVIRLNNDWNNESAVALDVAKLPLLQNLRSEQHQLAGDNDNVAAWFTREVQLSVRKRVLRLLKKDFASKVRICRKDLYPTWDYYLKMLRQFGAVVEAEPLEKLGYVDATCFVDPTGKVHDCRGFEVHMNDNYQAENYLYPQTITPPSALEGALEAVATFLFQRYHVLGYVTVQFMSLWDAHENIPRLWATGIYLGMRAIHGAMGTTAVAVMAEHAGHVTVPTAEQKTHSHPLPPTPMPLSLLPTLPDGKFFLYVPIVVHDPLKSTHDDNFFKLCRMRGIAFDVKNRVGTLFFLLDSVVGGAVSVLCIGATRKKSIEITIHTLTFVAREFGMDSVTSPHRADNCTNMLISLKKLLRHQD
ncbi:hypothetical protein B484DRAFT_419614 [Ochromonadaceae sp. CCMP2298]|nr:hypothetical protein B484DRAFT_419614 [Ochromonadaceae sp. CCMP2298]|mmetsp:Transcript_10189/g.22596  ORF Transcript_10189/g.22596 Transcript_10189/m.22596 type:complete len:908 (-) Transcript_10189:68-2791(-)